MGPVEAFVVVTAIVAGCILLALLFKYGAQAVRNVFEARGDDAAGANGAADALTQDEAERMIRRAVREEVQPLREKIEQLEQQQRDAGRASPPRREERPEEDPHDFGLIADDPAEAARKKHVT
ncbi:MAG: hypothetical protein BRD46_03175 [Bacteroidetes bacterium QS_8_68_15]|nr:MAG: hypothetical protein BRD46_03175 [Bacteroidetes bacterium QS_8_68_15]